MSPQKFEIAIEPGHASCELQVSYHKWFPLRQPLYIFFWFPAKRQETCWAP